MKEINSHGLMEKGPDILTEALEGNVSDKLVWKDKKFYAGEICLDIGLWWAIYWQSIIPFSDFWNIYKGKGSEPKAQITLGIK